MNPEKIHKMMPCENTYRYASNR